MTESIIEIKLSSDLSESDDNLDLKSESDDNRFYWYGEGVKKTRTQAIEKATSNGHHLARVPTDSWRTAIASYLKNEPAWIGAWKGDDYGGGPLVLHPNGEIGLVESGDRTLPFIIGYYKD
jgi:hypothetical protein